MNDVEFLNYVLDEIKVVNREVNNPRLEVLEEFIKDRIELTEVPFNVKQNKRLKKKLTQQEYEYYENILCKAMMFDELANPICESEEIKIGDDIYFCRREAFISELDNQLTYGFSIYKWEKTYNEVPLSPMSKETFKFKNWKEIFHLLSASKIDPAEMLKSVLERFIGDN